MTDMSTPRERIEKFMEMFEGNVGMPTSSLVMKHRPTGEDMKLSFDDLRAVLSANKGYESLMRDAAREAVADYKKELAESLEALKRGETEDGIDMLDNVIDGLKEGSL